MRPGSELLSPSEEQTLVALQYTSAGMIWIEDGQKHPLWDSINSTIEGDCFALFSRKNSSEKERKETGLESPDCKRSLDCPLCVKRGKIGWTCIAQNSVTIVYYSGRKSANDIFFVS